MTTPEDSQPTDRHVNAPCTIMPILSDSVPIVPGVYDGRLSGIRAAWPEPDLDFGPRPVVDNDRTMRRVRATRAASAELGRAESRGDVDIRRRLAPLALNMTEAALDAAGFDELLAAARLAETYRKALEALVDEAKSWRGYPIVRRIESIAREALR